MFLVHRERISTDETSDYAINKGIFFIRHEEILKRESHISKLINMDKLYEIVSNQDSDDLKRILFSYFRIVNLFLSKSHKGDVLQWNTKTYGNNRLNREEPPVDELQLISNALRRIPQSRGGAIKTYVKEYNFRFQNPDEMLLCYEFQDIDSYSALYEANEIEDQGSMQFNYKVDINFLDFTNDFVSYLIKKFKDINILLQDYEETASEICSYNNIDNRFNDFFVNSIREKYPTGDYPWETAPAIYSIMIYLLTDQFDSFEDTIRYSKNVSSTISPENGNLDSLKNFSTAMEELDTEQVGDLGAATPPTSTSVGYTMAKEANLIALNYTQLLSEADAEFESLFRNQMNYYDGEDIVVAPSGTAVYLKDGSPPNAPSTKTKAEFMALLLEAIEEFFLVYTSVFGGDANYSFDDTQQASLGSHIQSFINNLQKLFRGKRNETLKEKGFTMFQFGAIGNRTIDDPNVKNYENIFLRQVAAIYREANPAGTRVDFGYMYQSFGTMTNLIYNYYNSPRVSGDKQNLQYDISVGDFAYIPRESEIKNWIVFDLAPALPMAMGTYTGPEIFEIAGIEDISF